MPSPWPWALAFVVATFGVQWFSQVYGGAIFVRSAYAAGAWWQLVTGQWVHFGFLHALANGVAMATVLFILHGWVGGRQQAWALLGGYAGVAVVLAFDPYCATYAGASGALHGMLAGGAAGLLLDGPRLAQSQWRRGRLLAVVLLAGLGAKLLVQHLAANPLGAGWLGVATYHPAHEAGAAGGIIVALLARIGRFLVRARPHTEQQKG